MHLFFALILSFSLSLSSLAAGKVAATDGLVKLIGEREFSVLFHEGQQSSRDREAI